FGSGPGGERHGQHIIRVIYTGCDTVGDSVGDCPSFSGACPSQNAYRSSYGGGGLSLFSVQTVQNNSRCLQFNSLKFWVVAMVHRTSGGLAAEQSRQHRG